MRLDAKWKIFGCLALVNSFIYILLIYQNRLPIGHDTFQYLQQQYVYFNEVAQNHSLILWFPFMSQGSVGNYYFTPQLTLLSPMFYLLALFMTKINYLYLFYIALWFEEMFFLMSVVLLSSLYYKNTKTILFVSITLIGTTIWYPQIWWNFHLFYFIPIVLYSIHKCLLTGLFRYLILATTFFTLSVYGNFLYCGVFVSFVVLVYIVALIPLYTGEFKGFFQKNIKPARIFVFMILMTIILLSFFYIKYADSEITYTQGTREISGENNLETFLEYGGSVSFGKLKEIFRRYDKTIDINLFAGFSLPAFVLIAIFHCRKKMSFVVGAVVLVTLLFSSGTFVAKLFYYIYPLGKTFRHIGLTATVFKLFIVFYAGFGFEVFIESLSNDKKPNFLKFAVLMFLISAVVMAHMQIFKPNIALDILCPVSKTGTRFFLSLPYVTIIATALLFWIKHKKIITNNCLVSLILLVIALDLYVYKYSLINHRMPRVSDEVISFFEPSKYDFAKERLFETKSHINSNKRMKQLYPVLEDGKYGAIYNTIDSAFFADSFVSSYRTDFVLKSISEYLDFKREFPSKKITYEKYSGVGFPKLGVFSKLNIVPNEKEMGKIFDDESFSADMLFATIKDVEGMENIQSSVLHVLQPGDFKNFNERVEAKIEVKKFSFNTLELEVLAAGPKGQNCFLYHSEAYHPHWNAYVNGEKMPVIKSNIGYKSVMIPYGTSDVIFKFGNAFYYTSFTCTIFLNLLILCSIVYVFYVEVIRDIDMGNQPDKDKLLN